MTLVTAPPSDDERERMIVRVVTRATCRARTLEPVSAKGITDELVDQVADDLRARYGLDDEGVCARIAAGRGCRRAKRRDLDSAERFTEEHRETFDRLAE